MRVSRDSSRVGGDLSASLTELRSAKRKSGTARYPLSTTRASWAAPKFRNTDRAGPALDLCMPQVGYVLVAVPVERGLWVSVVGFRGDGPSGRDADSIRRMRAHERATQRPPCCSTLCAA